MAIICYGQIDKKLIFVIFIIIESILWLNITSRVPKDYSNKTLISLEQEIGPIITGLILYFIFKPKKEEKNRKSFKCIIYLFFLIGVKDSYSIIYYYFIKEEEYNYQNLNTLNGFEIIFITFGTFLLLKYKYYIHHMISMFLFCV